MVSGGESYEGLRDGSAPGYFDDPTRLGYLPHGGFGFLRSALIDTHTGAYGREGRAYRLAADTGHDRVYALEENTAIVVENPGTRHEHFIVLGPNGVAVLDLRHARTGKTKNGWTLRGARYNYLTDHDRYDAHTWQTRPSADKHRLLPTGTAPVPVNTDVFYRRHHEEHGVASHDDTIRDEFDALYSPGEPRCSAGPLCQRLPRSTSNTPSKAATCRRAGPDRERPVGRCSSAPT
ncbi:hypothetical protein [Streptomyces sp. NPDC005017]|uniref:hypothetical protein n=1 Tax=Streptomyces sp. NPDC005017 TaxID=3364706 RepID=UPI00369E8A0F